MKASARIGAIVAAAVAFWAATSCTDQVPTLPAIRAATGGGSGGLTVTATDPDSATQDTTLDVVVSGSGFDQGSQAQWAVAGEPSAKVHTNATRFITSKRLIANITIAADADPGLYDVIVTASTGKKGIGSELFAIRQKGVGQLAALPAISFTRNSELWVMNADGTHLFRVADDSSTSYFAASSWAPSGDGTLSRPYQLAFTAEWVSPERSWPVGIIELDTIGGVVNVRNLRILPTSEPAVHFAWSPLGDSIAIADGAPEGSWPSDIHLIAPDGTGEHTVYSAPGSAYLRYLAWSADGRYLGFILDPGQSTSSGMTYSIQVLDLVTREVKVLLEFPAGAFVVDLSWARTRNAVAYYYSPSCPTPNRKCPVGLYVLELDGSANPVASPRLLLQGFGLRHPSWSPDDRILLYSDGTVRGYIFATGQVLNLSTGTSPDWRR